jgi:CheY-like chemotaxis protein
MNQEPRNLRLVFVDDDVDMLPLYETIGEIEKVSVIVLLNGIRALSFLHEANYEVDAVITDLSMPDMSGISLTRHIRENEELRSKTPPIKMFWLTGWSYNPDDPNDPITSAKEEFKIEKIYEKPYDPTAIVNEIKELFNTSEENTCVSR